MKGTAGIRGGTVMSAALFSLASRDSSLLLVTGLCFHREERSSALHPCIPAIPSPADKGPRILPDCPVASPSALLASIFEALV